MKIILSAVVVCAIAVAAFAALSPKYAEWGAGPVQHLMTPEEITRWKAIQTDDEAQAFIDLFWARRDPTPNTRRNEFQVEFDTRVIVANRDFSSRWGPGAMSDRGKVLILLGPPFQIGSKGQGQSEGFRTGGLNVDLQSARGASAQQTWTYGYDNKPKFIKQKEATFLFVEENSDDWQLALTERNNPGAILRTAVQSYIISPNMTSVPAYDDEPAAPAAPVFSTSFKNSDLKTAYEAARANANLPAGPAHLTWADFINPEGKEFVSFQLYVPAGAGIDPAAKLTLFGAVENASGQIVRVIEEPVTLTQAGNDWYVARSVPLEPGEYTAVFGLAADPAKPVSMTRTKMTVKDTDPDESGVSQLLLSSTIQPGEVAWGDTSPFTFGGLRVVPKGDAQFGTTGDLWYFLEMRKPGVTPEGNPNVQVKVDIEGKAGDRKVRLNLPLAPAEITKLKGAEDRYAVGMAIPLENFKPGEYTMKVRIVDSVLGKNYDFERQFKVRG